MITRLAFFAAVLYLVAQTGLAAKPATSKGPEPDVMLRNFYKVHDAEKGPFYDRKNRQLAERYFTKELAAMIVKDATEADGEVGAYEMDPLYASQDPQVKNFKIGAVQWGGIRKSDDDEGDEGFALVAVTFTDGGKRQELRFGFEQQNDKTWRISEIHYPNGTSLLQLLRQAYPG